MHVPPTPFNEERQAPSGGIPGSGGARNRVKDSFADPPTLTPRRALEVKVILGKQGISYFDR